MELIKKLFGRPVPANRGEASQFHDTNDSTVPGSRNAPRRELVQVILRDCMRRHGIPSAWIDCRILSVVSSNSATGMHVQFIVKDGVERLLGYVPALQGSFTEEITRFDPRVKDWLFSVAWEFENFDGISTVMPDPAVWGGATQPAALSTPPVPAPAVKPQPGRDRLPTRNPAPVPDDDVEADLQALYAIRDASLRHGGVAAASRRDDFPDFESTRPGGDDGLPLPAKTPRGW